MGASPSVIHQKTQAARTLERVFRALSFGVGLASSAKKETNELARQDSN